MYLGLAQAWSVAALSCVKTPAGDEPVAGGSGSGGSEQRGVPGGGDPAHEPGFPVSSVYGVYGRGGTFGVVPST
jgi:hypothetical protein